MCLRLDTRQQEQGVQQEQDVKRAQTVDGLVALETRAVPHDPDELRYYPALGLQVRVLGRRLRLAAAPE